MLARFEILLHSNFGGVEYWAVSHVMLCNLYVPANVVSMLTPVWKWLSLVPRSPTYLPSVCIHNNSLEWKTSEKRGRLGSIHHVSGSEVDVGGGRGRYSNMYVLNL